MLPIKDLRKKELNLDDIFPNLPELLQKAIEEKEDIKKDIFEEVFKTVTGPQYNAVRICNFPVEKTKKWDENNDEFCEHYKICPMYNNQIRESVGNQCLFEVQKVEQLTNELIEDLGVNVLTDHNDRRMIGELVMYCLIEDRAIASLACNSIEMTKITKGKNGTTYEKTQNIHLTTISTMNALKTKVREKLVATKSDRLKMNIEKQKVVNADATAKIKSKLREVERKLKPSGGIGLISPELKKETFKAIQEPIPDKPETIEVIDVTEVVEKKQETKKEEMATTISFEDMFKDGV